MSGYNYNNWGRRGGECGPPGDGGNQNSGYWNSQYNKYENYNQYHYPQLTYPQQWNSVPWNKADQYSGTYGREQVARNKCGPRQPFIPSHGHSKAAGHSSSIKVNKSQSASKKKKRKGRSSSSRNQSFLQRKVTSPPLGSEEARKKTLAQATDKIKSCLLSFQNEKSEVLENLLSNKEQEVVELNKANPVRLEKSDYADLRLTPSDLKVIGMVTTSGTGPSSEMDETGYYTAETNSTNEFEGLLSTAEIGVHSSGDVFHTFGTDNTEVLDNVDRVNMISNHERGTGLKDSSKSIEPEPHCIYEQSRCTSEKNFEGQPAVGEDQTSRCGQHAQSGSASLGISNTVDDSNHTKAGTNKKISCEKLFHINRNEPNETLKNLKQRIIQQFLKMGKNNLKDLINNPRSRKFEFAMSHLMKEHRLLLSRELRGLAQSRIRGHDVENQGHGEPVQETSSLLDTDIEINLSHLPQEVIEQLGSLLQLDLLDNAESIDFQPITVDTESSVHDLQNIQALQVALLSEENIKRAAIESEIKPLVRREVGNTVDERGDERNLVVGHRRPDCQLSGSLINEGTGQNEEVLKGEMECEQQLGLEESAAAKKPRKESDKWPNYIPLAEGFMNSSVEFGNTFLEFPDFMGMSSTESEAVAGKNRNGTGIPCIRKTDGEADQHLKLETDHNPARTSDKPLNQEVASEASEAHVRLTHEMTDSNYSQEVHMMPREILNSEVDVHSNKHLSNTSQDKSIIQRFSTNCSSSCDTLESCSEEKRIDASQQEGVDSLHITTGDNISASDVAHDGQANEMLESFGDAVEQSEDSVIADRPVEGSEYSCEPLADNEEQLQGAAAADKSLEAGDNISASDVAHDGQANEMLESFGDAVEQSEDSVIADRPVEGSEYSCEPLADNEEQLQGAAAADKSLEGSSKPKNILFAEGIDNLNALVSGNIGGMTVTTDDGGSGENEIKAKDFKLSKENCVTSSIDRASVPSGRLNIVSDFVGKHTENLKTNFNTSDSDKNLNLQINRNEENSCSVEDETLNKETDRNQNENVDSDVSAAGDFSSIAVGTSFVSSGDNAENTNFDDGSMSSKKIIHSATAEHSIHTNDAAEIVKSGFCNAAEIVPSGGVEGSIVDGLPGICNMSVAEDNSAVVESLVSVSDDNDIIKVVTHIPISEEAQKMAGDCSSIVKSRVLDEDGCTENSSLAAEVSLQFELSSSGVASHCETHDDILEIHHSNVVVKTEKFDDDDAAAAEDESSQIIEQEQLEDTNDTSTVFPEPQNVDSLSHTQSSVIHNPIREVTTVEVGTQAELSEDLDSYDVQKILQLLEKSHHLSPQLAKSLKDHFSSSNVTKGHELSKLSNSIESVSAKKFGTASFAKEKSPPYLIIRPLNSKDVQKSHIIPKTHEKDAAIATRPLAHTSKLSSSLDGMRPSFQGPALCVNKEEEKSKNRINLAKPDDTNLELDRVLRVGGGSNDSEVSACVSDLPEVDTSDLNASIVATTCIDGDQNDDGINHWNTVKDVQGSSGSSNNKCVFLKMLEIDREIQKLMEMKLKLYTKLQPCLTTDATCRHSPKSTGLQCVSPTEVVSSHALCNRMKLGSTSNTEHIGMDFLTISSNKSTETTRTSDIAASASTPMVMLPAGLQNTCLSFPKQKLKKGKKTGNTSVMETNSQIRGEDSAVIHYSGYSGHSEILGGDNDAPSLKVELKQVDIDGANKVRCYVGPSLSDYHRESHQSEKNSSPPKVMSLKKQVLKPKHNVGKKGYSGDRIKQSHEQHKTGNAMGNDSCRPVGNQEKKMTGSKCESTIQKSHEQHKTGNAMGNDSCRPVGNQEKKMTGSKCESTIQKSHEQHKTGNAMGNDSCRPVGNQEKKMTGSKCESTIQKSHEQHKTGNAMGNDSCRPVGNQEKKMTGSKCESTIQKPVCADALIRSTVKELRSRNKHAKQRVGNITREQEFSQSDSDMGEDRKESVSPGRTKGLKKSNKQSETDSLTSCNTSARHSPRNRSVSKSIEQLSSQTGTRVPRNRGDAKTRSQKDVEIELEGVADTVCSREKVQSSKGKSFINSDESEAPDCVSRVTRKRKLQVKTDIVGDEYVAGSQEEPTENRSRRSFSRRTSDLKEIHSGVMDENAAEISTRSKGRVKIDQTDAVDEITLHARQLKKTVVSNSGYLLKGNNCQVQLSPEILTSAVSSRTRQHIDAVRKRKSHEVESPPSKVQHLDPEVNSVQWNLQKCFVMVKPLGVEKIDNSNKPQEELTTTNSLNKQIIRRSSNTSRELSLTDCAESVKKGTESKGKDLIHKLDNLSTVIFPEVEDHSSLQDPFEGIPNAETQWPEVSIEPNESITSSPFHLPPDFIVQSHSPGRLGGQCIVPQIAIQDENSISTLVSDTSDGEQCFARRNKHDEKTEEHVLIHSADDKDDWDQDSACSCDMAEEAGEGTSSKASKHRSSKKHKKDQKSDGIERLVFESHEGPVLDIKTVGRHVLAASEDGNVYCYSLKSGKFKRKFEGHNGAVTCLCVIECNNSNVNSKLEVSDTEQFSPDSFFTGSLDRHLRSFIFKTAELVQNPVDVGSSVQCMDHYCGIIYIGTQAGEVARFNIKTSSLIDEPIKIGRESILTLKATKEGPRQVLIVGSRNKPIAVRDAATGLLLRTVCNNWSHTVYSLALSANLVYCGTKTGTIPAFEFTSGDEVCRFQAAAGVVCLRMYNNLLFAGCYDGNIYVFSIRDKTQVACIAGPGKMLLCMDIVKNRIIAGSKDSNKLEAWMFPQGLRNHLKEAKHN